MGLPGTAVDGGDATIKDSRGENHSVLPPGLVRLARVLSPGFDVAEEKVPLFQETGWLAVAVCLVEAGPLRGPHNPFEPLSCQGRKVCTELLPTRLLLCFRDSKAPPA